MTVRNYENYPPVQKNYVKNVLKTKKSQKIAIFEFKGWKLIDEIIFVKFRQDNNFLNLGTNQKFVISYCVQI